MLPQLEPHEVVSWEQQDVNIKLVATDRTTIRVTGCLLRLTNKYIALSVPTEDGVTYRVEDKGDRNFHSIQFALVHAKPHRLVQPWFGPYKWETVISGPMRPELEPTSQTWTLTITFNSGGVFEFRQHFLKNFSEASEAASMGIAEVLPAYEE